MQNSKSRENYVSETLRLCHVLVNMKHGEEDDKNLKRLIRENLIEIAKIDAMRAERRQQRKADQDLLKYYSCL